MIKIFNRNTNQYEIEKVAGEGFLNYLYETKIGKAGLQFLIKRKIYSDVFGLLCNTKISAKKIESFITQFDINRNELIGCIEDFRCFNDFFTRKLKSDARAFDMEPEVLTSPSDGRIRAWENIDIDNLIQVKGINYSLKELLGEEKLAMNYRGGICIVIRLAPVDYHRFHFIDNGICTESIKIKGDYYSVNPIALNSVTQIFCRNKREYSILGTVNFGNIVYVEVGATSVGSIVQTYTSGKSVTKGDEKGYFKFGGSTIVLFLEKGTAQIDDEILMQTELGFETKVFAGERLGIKKKI